MTQVGGLLRDIKILVLCLVQSKMHCFLLSGQVDLKPHAPLDEVDLKMTKSF